MQVPAPVEYERATSVDHALELLERHGPDARLIAGGHSLLPMMKLRLAHPEALIDINDLADLSYIKVEGDELRIGAMTRHRELLESALAGEHFAILHDAERVIADPIVRNRGTDRRLHLPGRPVRGPLGGVRRPQGRGGHPLDQRASGSSPWTTSIRARTRPSVGPAEILTEVRIPIRPGSGSAYQKVERRVGDWAIVAAGALLRTMADGTIADAGIGLAAVGAEHFRAAAAEEPCEAGRTDDSPLRRGRPPGRRGLRPGR